jgi:hypothetical protein
VPCRRLWAKRGRKAGDVSVRMSGASCRTAQSERPDGVFRCEIDTGRNPDPNALCLV